MNVPYRSQYRSTVRRLVSVRLGGLRRLLRRPSLQLGAAALMVLAATLWLHRHTPELEGGGTVDLRASAYQGGGARTG